MTVSTHVPPLRPHAPLPRSILPTTPPQDDAPAEDDVKLEDMTNGSLPMRKTLRSDDPNHKSAEQIRRDAEGMGD